MGRWGARVSGVGGALGCWGSWRPGPRNSAKLVGAIVGVSLEDKGEGGGCGGGAVGETALFTA